MLKQLIGSQIVYIDDYIIKVELNGKHYTLEIDSYNGDCCGHAESTAELLYEPNSYRNPIITNVTEVTEENRRMSEETSLITFYGESKALATMECVAGSFSGTYYGAFVSIRCKELDINEEVVSW